ncbi:GTP-binding protein, partial [Klebsiella pneumoniae]
AELAIVTPIAGTTRDKVQQTIQIEGIPLNIVDTAGLRDTEDEVERIGIERTWAAIARADVVLHLLDATDYRAKGLSPEDTAIDARIAEHVPAGVPTLRVINKIDLSGVAIP